MGAYPKFELDALLCAFCALQNFNILICWPFRSCQGSEMTAGYAIRKTISVWLLWCSFWRRARFTEWRLEVYVPLKQLVYLGSVRGNMLCIRVYDHRNASVNMIVIYWTYVWSYWELFWLLKWFCTSVPSCLAFQPLFLHVPVSVTVTGRRLVLIVAVVANKQFFFNWWNCQFRHRKKVKYELFFNVFIV